ncbi:MAG: class I SAM-dependent methyltransferase [Chloroflexi bacterium]|nr:class I SAM-dependent methyltransferase [Chloroflexota bacterium]
MIANNSSIMDNQHQGRYANMADKLLTIDEAIHMLRADPHYADLVRDAYFGADTQESADRFLQSGEFFEVERILKDTIRNATVVDVGAGSGISSYAFAMHGAARVYALEPDPSDLVGCGAIERIRGNLPIEILRTYADDITLSDASVDIVYARQVLHHIPPVTKAAWLEIMRY